MCPGRARALASIALLAALAPGARSGTAPPSAALSIRDHGAWRAWWRAEEAPTRWSGPDSIFSRALAWRRLGPGVEWSSVRLAGSVPAWRTRLVVVRIDPGQVAITLQMDLSPADQRPAWTIDRAPRDALVAVNAGQFIKTLPWGWVVTDGRQRLSPGVGPLSCAIAIGSSGQVRWLEPDSLATPHGDVITGFQSYPTLLAADGLVPAALQAPGRGVDLRHRDARLAIGETRDGRLLVVMTRFDALGERAGPVPIGPTTPEMAAVMGALGARDAVMLDGGISAQMVLREPGGGRTWRWAGWRKVPLALIVRTRTR